jgi:hypothetical protein
MRTRNGKIARLPYSIRERLNERLERSEPSPKLLAWLNALPAVQEVIKDDFDGEPVSRQNLSQWCQGGFLEWQTRRDFCEDARDMAHCANELDEEVDGELADSAATLLAARFGSLIVNWNGEVNAQFEARTRVLNRLCRSVVQLQRGTHQAARENLEVESIIEEKEKAGKKEMQKLLVGRWFDTLREPVMARMFGGGTVGRKIAEYILAVKRGNLEADLDILPTDTYGNGKLFFDEAEPGKPSGKGKSVRRTGKTKSEKADKQLEENKMETTEVQSTPTCANPVTVCNSNLAPALAEATALKSLEDWEQNCD